MKMNPKAITLTQFLHACGSQDAEADAKAQAIAASVQALGESEIRQLLPSARLLSFCCTLLYMYL